MIPIKSQKEIEIMKEGGKLLASVMELVQENVKPGINTLELDKLAEKKIKEYGGNPSFKGFGGEMGNPFPGTLCTSINSEIVHGIPSEKVVLKEGDILKIDVGMEHKGMHTDMARTFPVGNVSAETKKIMEVTEKSFWKGVRQMKAGSRLSKYSRAVQKYVESEGFAIVRNLVGHGIGNEMHEDPQIPNYYNKKFQDFDLQAGMIFALEPMVNAGSFETRLDKDGWTFKTKDGKLSAHYENTVLVTEKGTEILTKK